MIGKIVKEFYRQPVVFFDGTNLSDEELKQAKEAIFEFKIIVSKHKDVFLVEDIEKAMNISSALNKLRFSSKAQVYDAMGNLIQ